MSVVHPAALEDVLLDRGLAVRLHTDLDPEHFLPQCPRPSILGVYVFADSAPLAVAHRKLGARTQSRVELVPGSCLLRGEAARYEWTLAIPPLLSPRARTGRPTRRIALLAAVAEAHAGAAMAWPEKEPILFERFAARPAT